MENPDRRIYKNISIIRNDRKNDRRPFLIFFNGRMFSDGNSKIKGIWATDPFTGKSWTSSFNGESK